MQTPTVAPPAPAQAPAAPGVTITTQEGGQPIAVAAPLTPRELRALRIRRDDLTSQLAVIQSRRNDVADALHRADPAARQGLTQRLEVLDAQIVQIETDIAATGRELTSAAAGLGEAARQEEGAPSIESNGEMFSLGLVSGVALMLAATWVRRLVRGGRRLEQPALAGVPPERMTRLEQSIDAIAVEVERISEGQRFTARLMAERQEQARREGVLRDA